MSSSAQNEAHVSNSASSSNVDGRRLYVGDEASDDEQQLLTSDPIESNITQAISFKRKQKPSVGFSIPKFLSSPLSGNSRQQSPAPRRPQSRTQQQLRNLETRNASTDAILPYLEGPSDSAGHIQDAKDANPMDWYVEGPGRRVGYDDLTAIDWIFEYAKERQRLRFLKSASSGILGHIREIADASQIWWILVLTGIASGLIAAFIDVASDWLGDLKTGYCKPGEEGGRFHLNRSFCCWGYDELAQCRGWHFWSRALGVKSEAGGYVVEYIFFILFSVAFAACASILVKTYAVYAKHSGIPEIKTVLGGFVMRRFMGAWTLLTKSLGLVSKSLRRP